MIARCGVEVLRQSFKRGSRAAFTLLFLFCACFLGPAREAGSYKALPTIELQS